MTPTLTRSFLAALTLASAGLPSAFAQTTERVSVDSLGVEGASWSGSFGASISRDGRYVAFDSYAWNLVPGDNNQNADIFVHDRRSGQTILVSVTSAGGFPNSASYSTSISGDGRFVAFWSYGSNLVSGDTNGVRDVFVRDLQMGLTSRVSVDSAGLQGNDTSQEPFASADGRYVVFSSDATNLVPGDSNGQNDIFIKDLQTGQTELVSIDSTGRQGNDYCALPSVTAGGRYVVFFSYASNLVPGDTNAAADIFVHDMLSGQTSMVSIDSAGVQSNGESRGPSISDDGQFVTFWSEATNLVPGDTNLRTDIFVHNRQTGQTARVSISSMGAQGNDHCSEPFISATGRYVVFRSDATNLVSGDTNLTGDVFLHDRQTGKTRRVSVDSAGSQGNGESNASTGDRLRLGCSADGRYVAFNSDSDNLVPADSNFTRDVFVRDTLGLRLEMTGGCPGATTLTVSNATANGSVAIIYGPAGVFVKTTPPCQGLVLIISPPTLRTIVTADGSGTVVLNFNAPPGACGFSVQGVDTTTCVATNVIVL